MTLFKRILAIIMAAAMMGMTACSDVGNTPSDESPAHREPLENDENTDDTDWVDTDGDFEYKTEKWSGPEGYVIVVSAGDSEAKTVGEYLQDYYKRVHGVTLKLVTDASKETEKEILIGDTNREESSSELKTEEIKVSLKGEKLVFEGGHSVTVEAAVKRFLRLMPEKNEAFTFDLATDFKVSPNVEGLKDYEYVWGDEFEDWYDIDFGKWQFNKSMTETASRIMVTDRRVIDIGDGRLKMRAINYFDPNNINAMFLIPYATATHQTMNYLYGYAEIRARIPFFKGIWPSFWGTSKTEIYPQNSKWFSEVDVFEIFGSEDTVSPNIHKWYTGFDYATIYGKSENHSQYKNEAYPRKTYSYKNPENLEKEYHIYGYEWTPNFMHFYVDGEKYCTMDIVNSFDAEPDMSMFREPQFLMFNLHVFTDDGSYKPNLIYNNMELLPAEYFVDYFRVYQINDGKSKIWTDTSMRSMEPEDRVKDIKEFFE